MTVNNSILMMVGNQIGLSRSDVKALYSEGFLSRAEKLKTKKDSWENATEKLLDYHTKSNAFGDPLLMLWEPSELGSTIKSQAVLLCNELPRILKKIFNEGDRINVLDFGSGYGLSTYSIAATLNHLKLDFQVLGVDILERLIKHSQKGEYSEQDLYFGIFSPEAKKVQSEIWENERKQFALQHTGGDVASVDSTINKRVHLHRNKAINEQLLPQMINGEDGLKQLLPGFKNRVKFQKVTPFDFNGLENQSFDVALSGCVFTMFSRQGQELALKALASLTERYLILDISDTYHDERIGIPRKIIQSAGFSIEADGILKKVSRSQNFDMKPSSHSAV